MGLCVPGRPLLGGVVSQGRPIVGSQALGLADLLALVAEAHHDVGVLACGVEYSAIAEGHLELDDRRLGTFRRSKGFACSCRSVQGMLLPQLEGL